MAGIPLNQALEPVVVQFYRKPNDWMPPIKVT